MSTRTTLNATGGKRANEWHSGPPGANLPMCEDAENSTNSDPTGCATKQWKRMISVPGPSSTNSKYLFFLILKMLFQEKMNQMPKGAHPNNIKNLCMFTGARRGKFKRFRVNRHIFRQLADSGKLAGVKKAYWWLMIVHRQSIVFISCMKSNISFHFW